MDPAREAEKIQGYIDQINEKLNSMVLKIGDDYDAYRRFLRAQRDALKFKLMLIKKNKMGEPYEPYDID